MPHSWEAYEVAEEIVKKLVKAKLFLDNDYLKLKARGIIQIYLEERKRR